MRKLIMLRGAPGSGKTRFAERAGLKDYILSPDMFRLLLASPTLTPYGKMTISQDVNPQVWSLVQETMDKRMKRGELVVLDATLISSDDWKMPLKLADKWGYDVAMVDFTGLNPDMVRERNRDRPHPYRVPDPAIDRMLERAPNYKVPDGILHIPVTSLTLGFSADIAKLDAWLDVPVLDFSNYRSVVHIGDLQGCHSVMFEENSPLKDGLQDDTAYLFIGDLFDRGIENDKVARYALDEIVPRSNCWLLRGNHEDHVWLQGKGLPAVSFEFVDRTLPQLKRAGITDEDLLAISRKTQDVLFYRHHGKQVMVSHAGLSTVPERPALISSHQYSHGTGFYDDPVDDQFDAYAPDGWFQIHGHRNSRLRPVQASMRSFNLEESVEYGGNLRGVTLDQDGWHPWSVRNPVFAPFRQRRHKKDTMMLPWMSREDDNGTIMSKDLRQAMAEHPGVREVSSASHPHIISLNFTKDVFFDKAWDDVVCKARGLFIDRETTEIVARSYDKFFTIGERPETSMDALLETMQWPVTAYIKENGFLGICGYDRTTDSLFLTSKSKPDSDFAGWFREIVAETMPSLERQDVLRRFMRDMECSMTFEVIDPVRDPHMVEYDRPKVILLDIIRRSSEFEKAPFEQVQQVGQKFGFETKQRGVVFKNAAALAGWHKALSTDMSKQIEGYVLEDAAGFQVKAKTPFYSFWKLMRGTKDMVLRELTGGKPARANLEEYLHQRDLGFMAETGVQFRDWCREQDPDTLRSDIITLRSAFETRPVLTPSRPR